MSNLELVEHKHQWVGRPQVTPCHARRHYFDIIDGKLAIVCRCGRYVRKLMK